MKKAGIACVVYVVAVCFFIMLVNSSFAIVGKWETDSKEDIEFFKDGTFIACSDFGEEGRYIFEDNRLVIMPLYDDAVTFKVKKINKNTIMLYEDDEDDGGILRRVR